MDRISCIANFNNNNNFTKSILNSSDVVSKKFFLQFEEEFFTHIDEAAVFYTENTRVVTKICEGYQFSIAFCGSLYGIGDLKKQLSAYGYSFQGESDAELCLICYIHFGEQCAKKLSGNFSFIIHDNMRQQIFALCDPLWCHPLFWKQENDTVYLSSRPDTLFFGAPKISPKHLKELLLFPDYPPRDIFCGIYSVLPYHYLKIKKGCTKLVCYAPSETCDIKKHCSATPNPWRNCEDDDEVKFCFEYPRSTDAFSELLLVSVKRHFVPLLSDSDFIPSKPRNNSAVLFPDILSRNAGSRQLGRFLTENEFFHKPIEQTLLDEVTLDEADLMHQKNDYQNCFYFRTLKLAKHCLLKICSDKNAPLNAFFDSGKILQLCEDRFDFTGYDFSPLCLISYLIKLNIWFLMYRPRIV